jgi:hypothetical protein
MTFLFVRAIRDADRGCALLPLPRQRRGAGEEVFFK